MYDKLKYLKERENEEEEYLKKYSSTKPRKCSSGEPLYKQCLVQKQYTVQDGGFFAAIPAILRIAGPFLLDYALNKFTGNGIMYKYKGGQAISDEHKRMILLNIMLKHPHINKEIFY